MATTETRLLLLGAVAIFEPVNGYQIRRELVSWGVESWANIRPFRRLYDAAVTEVRPTAPLAFQTALSLLPLVGRQDATALLRERLANLDRQREESAREAPDAEHTPPHVLALVDYWERIARVEREWLLRLLFRIGDGELEFAGEPMDWTPAHDDPGHQMTEDRERYLALLRR